ncbi:uncharacterized protein EMH_0027460 [Eimeria mitis]|uniref:Uncharacterized protein n=1 Tax=Eimeria mitis TaxID=44415 RepID=U6JZ91_9EIME|nr:uncharacterized protein EMH_0027460 [Eimeria mitis]CDJ30764.1 hypothetical protein EMH_0027460 [Eimeria mitis]
MSRETTLVEPPGDQRADVSAQRLHRWGLRECGLGQGVEKTPTNDKTAAAAAAVAAAAAAASDAVERREAVQGAAPANMNEKTQQ